MSMIQLIDSRCRDNPAEPSHDFLYTLRNEEYMTCSLVSVHMPYGFYNVNSSNNIAYLTLGGVDTAVTVPIGNYSIATLVTALNNATSSFTFAWNSTTYRMTITGVGGDCGFSLGHDLMVGTASAILGFSGYSGSGPFITGKVVNLAPEPLVMIDIGVGNVTYGGKKSCKSTFVVPVNAVPGGYIHFENTFEQKIKAVRGQIRVRVYDSEGNLLDLNGVDWVFGLAFS